MGTRARAAWTIAAAGTVGAATLALIGTGGATSWTVQEPKAGQFRLVVVGNDAQRIPDISAAPSPGACRSTGGLDDWLPDPKCTPGAVTALVTQTNIRTTICRPGGGWGLTGGPFRPPQSITAPAKRLMLAAYAIPKGTVTELDHLVPITLGGSNSIANLSPEPSTKSGDFVTNPKDLVEAAMRAAVCRRKHAVPLRAAQMAMATDWRTALTVTKAAVKVPKAAFETNTTDDSP